MACLRHKTKSVGRAAPVAAIDPSVRTWEAKPMRLLAGFGALILLALPATAAEMRGVTATEIKIGQTMPYSGPVSAFGALGKGEVGYFKMVNERGGINGRKVNLISLDDSYAPPKTVEQTRRLVESDEVALIFSSIGTAHNTAIAKYLQSKNIPQLFLASGASKFADIAQFPQATVGVQAPFRYEARLYARYALSKNPNAKFAVISQNDDYGRDYLAGLKDVLGDKPIPSSRARPTKSPIRPSTPRS
jgi:branched-chain amino acid transport system substrate-binding protein